MSQLLLTSLYEDSGKGTLRLIGEIDLKTSPWFWPPVAEISCKQKKVSIEGPPWSGDQFKGGVQPKTPPGGWTDVVDQTEDGRKILVGRIPHWDGFWAGSPPTNLRSEISHAEVDVFLNGLMRGTASSAKVLFEEKSTPWQSMLPPKTILGARFPIGPVVSGPLGPDPRDPVDPRPVDTRRVGDSSNCWERICCIGLDVEKREVTAIVEITQTSGYGGLPCDSKSFISVGFWLVEPSGAEIESQIWESDPFDNSNDVMATTIDKIDCTRQVRFLGSSKFAISDIPRRVKTVRCADPRWSYDTKALAFSSSLPLRFEDLVFVKRCSSSPRLPVLHCVIGFNQEIGNTNFLGDGVRFGDYTQRVVQFPVSYPCGKMKPGIEIVVIKDEVTKARPAHVANLPNGDILFFSGSIYGEEIEPNVIYDPSDSVAIFRPSTNEIIPVGDPPFDIFCAGHSTLADGNVVIMGGTFKRETKHLHAQHWPGLKDVTIFNWRTSKFEKLNYTMREGRWYPSSVVLGSGEVFICDGHPTLDSATHTNFDLEILSANGDRIVEAVENGNVSMGSADFTEFVDIVNGETVTAEVREVFQGLYPRMILLPNGEVFSASSMRSIPVSPVDGWVKEEDRINKKIVEAVNVAPIDKPAKYENHVYVNGRVFRDNSYVFDPYSPWVYRQVFEASKLAPDGHGPIWGFLDPAVLLPLYVNNSTGTVVGEPRVMTFLNARDCTIQPLKSGGDVWVHAANKRDTPDGYNEGNRTSRNRVNGNLVLLPDGSVMAVGGGDFYDKSPKGGYEEDRGVKEIEYFVPGGSSAEDRWRTDVISKLRIPRLYHSTAILLLDGRVMVAGGNTSELYAKDFLNEEKSFREIEIITPDYYRNGLQPEFMIDRDAVSYGELISFGLLNGTNVNELAKQAFFIRCASFTHAFGYDQRAVELRPYGQMTGDRYQIKIPENRNIMPPGYYMCFIVSSEGVPSCGRMVKIG